MCFSYINAQHCTFHKPNLTSIFLDSIAHISVTFLWLKQFTSFEIDLRTTFYSDNKVKKQNATIKRLYIVQRNPGK